MPDPLTILPRDTEEEDAVVSIRFSRSLLNQWNQLAAIMIPYFDNLTGPQKNAVKSTIESWTPNNDEEEAIFACFSCMVAIVDPIIKGYVGPDEGEY